MSEPIYIPAGTEDELRQTAIHVASHPPFFDPGPGVADVENLHRTATQAPEAPIPLDPLALDPVDVAQLDRIQELVDGRETLLKRIAMLKDVIAKMDKLFGAAIRERDEARDGEGVREVVLKAELRASERDTRNAIYLAAFLFCALCWREGWRVWLWIWRML